MKKRIHWTQTEEGKRKLAERRARKNGITSVEPDFNGDSFPIVLHVVEPPNPNERVQREDVPTLEQAITLIQVEIARRQSLLKDLQELAKKLVDTNPAKP